MKNINGVRKIAVKVNGQEAGVYRLIAEQLTGSRKILDQPGLTAYQLPDGATLEIYGIGSCYPEYLFEKSNVVVHYKVTSLDDAVKELEQAGAERLGCIIEVCSSYRYCHFRLNGETVLGIYEEK